VAAGANAQEESVCRSSGLFLTIKDSPIYGLCRGGDSNEGLYHDAVIFSPGVPVIKDDEGRLLPPARLHSVTFLTCPAVNAKVTTALNHLRVLQLHQPTYHATMR